MAAVQTPQAVSTLTPPASAHGHGGASHDDWDYAVSAARFEEDSDRQIADREPLAPRVNNSYDHAVDEASGGYPASARVNTRNHRGNNVGEENGDPDSQLDMFNSGPVNGGGGELDYRSDGNEDGLGEDVVLEQQSKWIHRDKLARIESEEMQAAGIVLPRTRASSKSSRRAASRDRVNAFNRGEPRRRMTSEHTEEEEWAENGDLRSPGEILADNAGRRPSVGSRSMSVSRIPVARSHIPVPSDAVERGPPAQRSKSNTGGEENAPFSTARSRSNSMKLLDDTPPLASPTSPTATSGPSPRKRIGSDSSPTKKATPAGAKKAQTPGGPRSTSGQRPKTSSGKNTTTTNQRPVTRSGEMASIKTPEGDPPWMESMYKPDPRLPPDQQLLPTVAKRLQQEQWEREGKFGTAYDKDFRPLNDNEFQPRPESMLPEPEPEPEVQEKEPNDNREWPLTAASGNNLTINTGRPGTAGGNSYSTMPKIQGKPQGLALPSPLPIRVQEPEEDNQKKGCACCIIM